MDITSLDLGRRGNESISHNLDWHGVVILQKWFRSGVRAISQLNKAVGDSMTDELQLASPAPAPCTDFIIRNNRLKVRWHKEPKVCWPVIFTQTVKCWFLKSFPEIGVFCKEGEGYKWRSSGLFLLLILQRRPNTSVASPLTCFSSSRSIQCVSGQL